MSLGTARRMCLSPRRGFQAMKKTALAVVEWVKRNGAWLLLVMLGAWTGAVLLRKRSSAVATLEQALAVQRSKTALEVLRTKQAALQRTDAEYANKVLQVSAEITAHKKAIAEAHTGKPWSQLSDDAVREALRAAGL